MNYREIYLKIIISTQKQNRKKVRGKNQYYYEKHHILPKSLFPLWKDRKSNLVILTAREHFFCHQLLCKIYPSRSMYNALWRLSTDGRRKITSKEYERIKIKRSELLSQKRGYKRPPFSEQWKQNIKLGRQKQIITDEHKQKISDWATKCKWYNNGIKETFCEIMPKGYKVGRLPGLNNTKKVFCVELNKSFNSLKEASLVTGANYTKICEVCRGSRKQSGGYTWKYI